MAGGVAADKHERKTANCSCVSHKLVLKLRFVLRQVLTEFTMKESSYRFVLATHSFFPLSSLLGKRVKSSSDRAHSNEEFSFPVDSTPEPNKYDKYLK